MAVKKATPTKPVVKKAKKKISKGDGLVCEVCGLAIVVDDEGDVGVAEILCCEEPMKPRRAVKSSPKTKAAVKAKVTKAK